MPSTSCSTAVRMRSPYPFVPSGAQSRDNPEELRLSSVLKRELSIESDLSRWYALWGVPLT